MINDVKNSLFNSILLSVCVFVGAGFITGAEIWFYFAKFNFNMVFGLIIFGFLCFNLVIFAQKSQTENIKLKKSRYFVSLVSELLIASAMISGIFYTVRILFRSLWVLVDVLAISCLIFVFVKGIKFQKIYNYFIAIFIIFVIVSLFLFNNKTGDNSTYFIEGDLSFKNAFLSCVFAIIYIFMNIATMRPIIEKFDHNNKRKNKIIFACILSLTLIFLIFTLSLFLWKNPKIANTSMPFLLLFYNYSDMVKFIFLIGLLMCMISTAAVCFYGVCDKLNYVNYDDNFNKTIVILSSLIIGQLSFKFFVNIIYPVVGIFNFLLFAIEIFYSKKFE